MMSTKPKPKFDYYNVDTGFFPAQLKLCFSDSVFQQILKDHGIATKEQALTLGLGETHVFTDDKKSLIVVVFDLAECDTADPSFLVSTICHESVHCAYRVLEYVGEEAGDWGEETFAYLTDHIAKQIFVGIQVEKEKRAGTNNRSKTQKTSQGKRRSGIQVDKLGDGGKRSDSISELTSLLSRIKDGDGETEL